MAYPSNSEQTVDSVAQDQLRSILERVERLEEEKKALGEDIKSVYAEAKGNGYSTATIRAIVRLRRMDPNKRMESAALMETYLGVLGSYDDGMEKLF